MKLLWRRVSTYCALSRFHFWNQDICVLAWKIFSRCFLFVNPPSCCHCLRRWRTYLLQAMRAEFPIGLLHVQPKLAGELMRALGHT